MHAQGECQLTQGALVHLCTSKPSVPRKAAMSASVLFSMHDGAVALAWLAGLSPCGRCSRAAATAGTLPALSSPLVRRSSALQTLRAPPALVTAQRRPALGTPLAAPCAPAVKRSGKDRGRVAHTHGTRCRPLPMCPTSVVSCLGSMHPWLLSAAARKIMFESVMRSRRAASVMPLLPMMLPGLAAQIQPTAGCVCVAGSGFY